MGPSLTLDDYQTAARKTAVYPPSFYYPALGLAGEAGEIANKVKKIYRDHNGVLTNEIRVALIDELGDVLWYCASLATELDTYLSWVGDLNIAKLQRRQITGKLQGSGDER